MATQDRLWSECVPGGLAEAAGALSPRASLTELVPRTTQSRRGGDTGELFRRYLSCLSGQRSLYQEGEEQRQNPTLSPQPVHEARERRRADKEPPPFRSAMRCGQGSRVVF